MEGAQSVVEQFARRVERSGGQEALRYRAAAGWQGVTWQEWNEMSRKIAAGLIALGIEPEQRIVALSGAIAEWAYCEMACQMVGATFVPLFGTTMPEMCCFIIKDSGAKILFVEDPAQLAKVVAHRESLSAIEKVIYFRTKSRTDLIEAQQNTPLRLHDVVPEGSELAEWVMSLDELALIGEEAMERGPDELAARAARLRPTSPSALVYTSGTTGPPKGVTLSHGNFLASMAALVKALPIGEQDIQLLILPLAHILGYICLRSAIEAGSVTAFSEGPQKLLDNLKAVRPTYLVAVPRVCEKVYYRIMCENNEGGAIEQALFNWSVAVGTEWSRALRNGIQPSRFLTLRYRTAEQLVFRKVRALFGGRLRFLLSGGASLTRQISEFLHAAGILVLEGYGLTETTAASHVNRPHRFKLGSVGQPLEGVEVKIAPDGEILLRGPIVMREYSGRPEETSEIIDPEGWLHSGDVGSVDEEGFLTITDRKRDIIVMAGGANVSPANIENLLRSGPFVSHALVYGDGRPFLSALITLDEEVIRRFAAERRIAATSYSELCQHPEVYSLVEEIVEENNALLPPHERIRKFAILDYDFTLENGELTPTDKIRRRHTIKRHNAILESFYREQY